MIIYFEKEIKKRTTSSAKGDFYSAFITILFNTTLIVV